MTNAPERSLQNNLVQVTNYYDKDDPEVVRQVDKWEMNYDGHKAAGATRRNVPRPADMNKVT